MGQNKVVLADRDPPLDIKMGKIFRRRVAIPGHNGEMRVLSFTAPTLFNPIPRKIYQGLVGSLWSEIRWNVLSWLLSIAAFECGPPFLGTLTFPIGALLCCS